MTDEQSQSLVFDAEVDAVGLDCPMPLLKAKLELNRLASGAVLKVIASDPGSQRDFRSFAKLAGHALLREEAEDGLYRYWLRKA
ncbi:sulfurtransferase TusA family protein [Pseudomonas stutzeri]|uniref:Response regulator SirA n=1 Tax=Stutzerimonas stutzeri TaxID=316 RepID=A0A2N8S6N9_STUST|nr:sulfurtransferase TusA family protein [Stutzerimonas stutzeri]MCQ4294584.1 sulfurtransferase TusA family protein [Stutzerimonas stutzeri]PNF82287.1 response regulator SirA [Stutzerimonas stutzeri]